MRSEYWIGILALVGAVIGLLISQLTDVSSAINPAIGAAIGSPSAPGSTAPRRTRVATDHGYA